MRCRGVGKNMQDHYVVRVTYPVVGIATANERRAGCRSPARCCAISFTGKGMLTYSASLVAASVKVLPESATPDIQCSFAPGSFKDGQVGQLERRPRAHRRDVADAAAVARLCRGARPNRPGDAPAINPRYLSDETDRRAVLGGVRYSCAKSSRRRR